jgi:hypothetical protein
MKKIILIVPILSLFVFASCKRSYVCECTLYNIQNNQFTKISSSEETLGKLSNRDAESASPACESKSFIDNDRFRQTRCFLIRK